MFTLAKNIHKITNEFKISFYVRSDVYIEYKNDLNKNKFIIINESDLVHKGKFSKFGKLWNNYLLSAKSKLLRFLKFSNFTNLFSYKLKQKEDIIYEDLVRNYQHLRELLNNHLINIFLLGGDRNGGLESVFLKLAKDLGCKVIIPYVSYFAEQESLLKFSKTTKKKFYFSCNYIKNSEKKFRSHIRENNYYYPHPVANATDRFGVLSDNPWFVGNGPSDILCLPNSYLKEHYIRNGNDPKKIKSIGDISYDNLYKNYKKKDELKDELLKKYNLDKNKKIIITALPQLAEHNLLSWKEHWKEINFLVGSVDSLQEINLISLHPKMNFDNYKYLQAKYNCMIIDESLSTFLPVADMFIATFSSTVFWSILCGVKTVIVDFYCFNYSFFDFLTSVVKVNDKNVFEKKLRIAIQKDFNFTKDWKSLSRGKVFDGNTIYRYVELFRSIS